MKNNTQTLLSIEMPEGTKPIIIGCEGYALSSAEKDFFASPHYRPAGVILFSRNCANPEQLTTLVHAIKNAANWDIPFYIDQEGGNNDRLHHNQNIADTTENLNLAKPEIKPWSPFPSLNILGEIVEKNFTQGLKASYFMGLALGTQLYELGIFVDIAPVLDVKFLETHQVIASRAFSDNGFTVAALGQQMIQGILDAGVVPVMKHLPGQGRALQDSHKTLPSIDTDIKTMFYSDFHPFRLNAGAGTSMAMLSHVCYPFWDKLPATQSTTIVKFIREEMNIQSLLVSDCIYMDALQGTLEERAQSCHRAGIDLICASHGSPEQNQKLCDALPPINKDIRNRYTSARRQANAYRQFTAKYSGLPIDNASAIYELFQKHLI